MKRVFLFFRFDNEGFNNKEKYSGKPDILLMGSSHMEAVQVKQEENTGYLLNEYLDYHTYNIGISGHTIYSCVKNLSKANAYYSPSNYIIIETDSVELNNDKMEEVLKGKYPTIPSYSSGAFYQSQIYFPVVKMMYKKILDWKSADVIDSDHNNQASTETYLNLFLKKAKTDAGHATLIIMYHPSINFNNSGKMIVNNDGVDKFEKSCKENGIVFVNMTNDFEDLYYDNHKLPYGFINTGVGVGHLNKYGHKIIAERLTKTIEELEGQK